MNPYFLLLITFALWAVLHSLTAMRALKDALRRWLGDRAYAGFYRLLYNLLAVVSILPLLWVLATQVSPTEMWRWSRPGLYLALAIQLLALVGLGISLLQTDVWRFIGLSQVIRYLQGAPEPDPPASFVSSGTYALVRHPLYLFSLLLLWFTPVVTLDRFLFNVLATVYFWLGSLHEERRLRAEFGETYRQYQQSVPYLIPFVKRRGS